MSHVSRSTNRGFNKNKIFIYRKTFNLQIVSIIVDIIKFTTDCKSQMLITFIVLERISNICDVFVIPFTSFYTFYSFYIKSRNKNINNSVIVSA